MKKFNSIVVVGLLLLTSNSWASEATSTSLDEELENGLTVAQTLTAWDNSSVRYRIEPPMVPQSDRSVDSQSTDSEKS